jgi:hypothetical protein
MAGVRRCACLHCYSHVSLTAAGLQWWFQAIGAVQLMVAEAGRGVGCLGKMMGVEDAFCQVLQESHLCGIA